MKQKTLNVIVGVIFALVALLHLLRIIFAWQMTIGPLLIIVPMWISWVGFIIAGFLSHFAFRLAAK